MHGERREREDGEEARVERPGGDGGRAEDERGAHGDPRREDLDAVRDPAHPRAPGLLSAQFVVDGEQPACAKTCPTRSIAFGDRDDLVAEARERVEQLRARGMTEARLYGANPKDGVGGTGSVFLLLDDPEVYGLPPDPQVPTAELGAMWKRAGIAAAGMLAATALAFATGRK